MSRVLIAGCGDVGCRLGHRLVAEGHTVWGLRRHPETLPPELQPAAADLADRATLTELPARLDAVVYTAAADAYTDDAYRRAYVLGLDNLLSVLEARSPLPRRVLFASSTGVYGQIDGGWVDEASPTEPEAFSGLRVLEGERRCRASAIPSVSLRLGGIYGPGRTRLLDRVAAGEPICAKGPPRFTNRIHSEDAAGALAHLLALATPESIYVAVDHEPAPLCDVVDFLAGRLGVAAPRTGSPPVASTEDAGRRGGNKRCSSRRLRDSGYVFLYPTYREGYEDLLREHGGAKLAAAAPGSPG